MRTITVDAKDYVRDVKFVKVGNGPALRVGRLMQSVGASFGTTGRAFRVKGGIFIAIAKAAAKPKGPAKPGQPRFQRVGYAALMNAFSEPNLRLKSMGVVPAGREIP